MGDPIRSITPTLDGPVLAVLVRSGRRSRWGKSPPRQREGSEIWGTPMPGPTRRTGAGDGNGDGAEPSPSAQPGTRCRVRRHHLADLRIELWRRMRKDLVSWRPKPHYACVFGSAARGDGDVDSDVVFSSSILLSPETLNPWEDEHARHHGRHDDRPDIGIPRRGLRRPRQIDKLRAHVVSLEWQFPPSRRSFLAGVNRPTAGYCPDGEDERRRHRAVGSPLVAIDSVRLRRGPCNGPSDRTVTCGKKEAQVRLSTAECTSKSPYRSLTSNLATSSERRLWIGRAAGIAASDAICCA